MEERGLMEERWLLWRRGDSIWRRGDSIWRRGSSYGGEVTH
jgi:hypothetical protein